MKLKVVAGIILTLLLTSTLTVAFNVAPVIANADVNENSDDYQMRARSNTFNPDSFAKDLSSHKADEWDKFAGDSTLNQKELNNASDFSNAKTGETPAKSRISNIFQFNSFVKDISTDKIGTWRDFAEIDEDSAELVIGIKNAQPDSYIKISNLIVENGGKLVNTVSAKGEEIAVVADLPLELVPSFAEDVQGSTLARYIEPNMKYQTQLVPDDPYWSWQWGPQKIEANWAWNTTIGDPSILVAVIDTGVDYDHSDLAANYVPLGYDWVNYDPDPMDDNGHGTHCAGIIAAVLNNGIGIAGVAQIQIMAEKGLDSGGWGNEEDLANAIIHAVDQGADILSNSWSGGGKSQLIYDAVKYAYDNGVLVVAAAGNYASMNKQYPAAYDEVIAVTATDQWDDPAMFTNFGDWVEVAAPGVNIYSTILGDTYAYLSGTSMSTPHVSGTAALIWSQFPNMTRDWVRARLRYSADDLGDPGFDDYYGYGRINVRRAVEQAPSNHDLLIFNWEIPLYVEPGNIVAINTTALNFGTNDESNITVQLLVDDNIVDSASIGFLTSGTSTTVSTSWNTTSEGIYKVTSWVVPVPGENITENNARSVYVNVRYAVKIGIIETHGESLHNEELWNYYISLGHIVEKITTTITLDILKNYDIVIVGEDWYDIPWLVSEITAVQAYINSGKGFIGIGDELATSVQQILDTYGIGYTGISGNPGSTTNFDPNHPIMWGVSSVYASNPVNSLQVKAPAYYIANDAFDTHILIAGAEVGGYALSLSDDFAADLYVDDNEIMFKNIVEWISVMYEHELVVTLEAPLFLEPGNSSLLIATVYNRGLNNETNVELFLLINGTIVNNVTILEMVNETSYSIDYLWTPNVEAIYNATAYAVPVSGENITVNNRVTRFVTVTHPLIRPIEGQWANYILNYYDGTGRMIGMGYWNFTYDHYVEPYLIYITLWFKDTWGYIGTGWMIVNIMNRWVESGIWAGLWYPGWIETNLTLGSTINLLEGMTTVSGSKIIPVTIYPIDCWELPYGMNGYEYILWYDKVSGLWISMEYIDSYYGQRQELLLVDTNIPIGTIYEHELAATLEAPSFLEPEDSSLLKATIYNIGLNTENNVKLSLIINGTEVESETIATLPNGTSYTLSYQWTPTIEATYNVSAYAQPVPGENITVNNIATKIVRVRPIKGYVLFDQTHWTDSIVYYNIWVTDLIDRGYIVDTLTISPITLSILEDYNVFVIPQAHDYYSSDELSAIQDFVLNGGGLLVIGDDAPYVYTDLTSFASITWDLGGYGGYIIDITPHPVTEGIIIAYFSSPGLMRVTSPAQDIIRDQYGNVMLTVSEVGFGAVIGIADENSIDDYSISYGDNQRLANNMIDWLNSRRPVASLTYSPMDPYVGETVTFDASASYDPDGTIVSYIWNFGDGASGIGNVTTHMYAAGGTHTVTLTVIDNEGLSSTATTEVTVLRTTIDVQVKVGSIHFRGEIAEFYVLVSSLGKPIDTNISATLYYNGTPKENLSASVEHVILGLYRIQYIIPLNAPTGTYALVVEADYFTLRGISFESFLLSSTIELELDAINATLVSIEGKIATIETDIGVIRTDVDILDAKVTAINGTVATIQTTLGTISGTISSIQGDIATIETDIGTIKTTLKEWTGGTSGTITTPAGNFQILVLTTSTLEGSIGFSDNVLAISVSGLSGTTGKANVVIPKQLLVGIESSIDEVVVTIDDEQFVFIYIEQPEAYVLQITYTHSIRLIKVYLTGLPPTPFMAWAIVLIVIIVAVATGVAFYILKIRKPRITLNSKSTTNLDF